MPPWVLALGKLVEPYWAIVLVIAVPVAGVVGFLANLASLKKTRLENRRLADELARMPKTAEKLELELDAMKRLRREAEERQQKAEEEAKKEARLLKPADEVEMRRLLHEKARFEREMSRSSDKASDLPPVWRQMSGGFPKIWRLIIWAIVLVVLYKVAVAYRDGVIH